MPHAPTVDQRRHRLYQLIQSPPSGAGSKPKSNRTTSAPFDHLDPQSRLQSLIDETLAQPSATARAIGEEVSRANRCKRKLPQFPPGAWYLEGFYPDNVYRVENLVDVWRAFSIAEGYEEPVGYTWTLREPLLRWLKSCEYEHCEDVVVYAIRNWAKIRLQFQLLEAETPQLNIIYGFRRGIASLMSRPTTRKQQTQVPVWRKEAFDETEYEDVTY